MGQSSGNQQTSRAARYQQLLLAVSHKKPWGQQRTPPTGDLDRSNHLLYMQMVNAISQLPPLASTELAQVALAKIVAQTPATLRVTPGKADAAS